MNVEEFRMYCLSKAGASEDMPFDDVTLTFKVKGKIFAATGLGKDVFEVNLKCDPERAVELRESYDGIIIPGYHMSKVHWNTLYIDQLPADLIRELIDHSYDLIVSKFPKRTRELYDKL